MFAVPGPPTRGLAAVAAAVGVDLDGRRPAVTRPRCLTSLDRPRSPAAGRCGVLHAIEAAFVSPRHASYVNPSDDKVIKYSAISGEYRGIRWGNMLNA